MTPAKTRPTVRGQSMPKVTFVNERRTVETAAGRTIAQVAAEAGIQVCREEFAGTGFGDYSVWVKGAEGSVSPPGFFEKLRGARGWKRFANRAQVLGDVDVYTQCALGERLRTPRPIDAVPTPATNPDAPRLGVSAAGTAAFPTGNPLLVGKGTREPVARGAGKGKAKAGGAEPAEGSE